ncbi:Crp/Fnr family transcriptional regulator [Actinocorallia sp. A-T 12471]|uniref:Crp/Fnr family transcriptional regulator n=1 Tax=Actinocorallia sp. A-T 12471 TaxID=3089813 RepID=UPI0029CD4A31|nr:Crp/Fnr family transcriptional regulator [Actinocorallia sp. A-T 12471]MDX6743431.1 Crp/Fnr family transcriptional regulator [Actinocorallia sp. A-T 12471]
MTPVEPSRPENFWSSLEPPAREALLRGGRVRTFPAGTHLLLQGERPDQVLIIKSGWAKVAVGDLEGREVVIAVRGPGELVGETGLLNDSPRTATLTALHPVSALSVTRPRFAAFLNDHPQAWPLIYRTASRRLAQSDGRIVALGSLDGAARLARLMLALAEESGTPDEGGVRLPPLSQEELGSCVDASRETVARALRDWRQRGLIRTRWRRIVLLDPEGLRKLLGES